jgi:c(7)-type cytochrome triheme protein
MSMVALRRPRTYLLVAGGLLVAAGVVAAPPAQDPTNFAKPFEHSTHLKQLLKNGERTYTCNDCHVLTKAKDAPTEGPGAYAICSSNRMPFPSHDKCIGCHPTAFFQKPLQVCTNCHVDISITKQAELKVQTGEQAPLRTVFDHQLHLDDGHRVRKKFKFEKDCSFCHEFQKGGESVSLPKHAQCCECHTQKDVEPKIDHCAGCHTRPRSEANPRSMVKKFSHKDHKSDPKSGASVPCLRCHFDVPRAKTITSLQLPKMATCVECHEGTQAFSYADCLKCHEKGIEMKLVPEDHKAAVDDAEKKKKK